VNAILADVADWFSTLEVDNAWFLGFWLFLIALALVETTVPAFQDAPRRQQRWPTNLGLALINMTISPLVPVSAVLGAQWAERNGFGLLNIIGASWWPSAIATIAIRSFALYVFHIATHKVSLFWRFHRVHHCDTHLDVSTTMRAHPIEYFVLFLTMVPVAILFGLNPVALIAYQIFESAVDLFNHSNIRLPERWDRALRWLIVTPNMHCLHHSSYRPETDSNYGGALSIWDRLFGTYSAVPKDGWDGLRIGLKDIDFDHASDIIRQIKLPAFALDPARTAADTHATRREV
jgi:sterol desaturase/sphingolipid hydroxylase (fatty acid hydroxylase superfamily)